MPNLVVQHTHRQRPKVSIGLVDAAAIRDYVRKGDPVDRDEVDFLNANGVLLGMGGGNQGSILEEMADKSCCDHGENDFGIGVNFQILYRVLDCWGEKSGCLAWIRTMTNRSRICSATVTPRGSGVSLKAGLRM